MVQCETLSSLTSWRGGKQLLKLMAWHLDMPLFSTYSICNHMKHTVGEKEWRPFEANERHVWMVRCAASRSTAAFQCKATTWKLRGVVARAALSSSDFCSRMATAT